MTDTTYMPVKNLAEQLRIFTDGIKIALAEDCAIVLIMYAPDGDMRLQANIPPAKQLMTLDVALHMVKDMK